jgi:hypothetical protein
MAWRCQISRLENKRTLHPPRYLEWTHSMLQRMIATLKHQRGMCISNGTRGTSAQRHRGSLWVNPRVHQTYSRSFPLCTRRYYQKFSRKTYSQVLCTLSRQKKCHMLVSFISQDWDHIFGSAKVWGCGEKLCELFCTNDWIIIYWCAITRCRIRKFGFSNLKVQNQDFPVFAVLYP